MQLKKVELNGFKSFANKTELLFQDGVTTIVGPNGSGKSNISDAVKWVLGEQSAKSLRGGKMEDVIFAGTENRKMVGYAEVVITLTNESHILPVDYDEVEVTRRLYRSGESQYYINKNQCRLKDIQELFMDTGVGRDGYSIISQGKIDEILSSKSEERRNIFEEAAGIVKYKTRKEEAEKKLKNAEENLLRIGDILAEITENLEPLREQSMVARRYLEVKNDLKYIDVSLFVEELEKNNYRISEIIQLLNVLEHNLKSKEIRLKEILDTKNVNKEKISAISDKVEKLQEELLNIKSEAITKKNKIESDLDKIKVNKELIEEYKQEISVNSQNIEKLQEEIKQKQIKKDNYLKDKEKFSIQLKEKEEEFAKLSANMDEKQKEIEDIKENVNKKSEENAEIRAANNNIEENILNAENRISKISKEYDLKISEIDSNKLDIESKNKEKETSIFEYNSKEESIKNIENYLKNLNEQNAKKQEEIYNLKQNIDKKQSEHDILVAMEENNEGYSKSVKSVLDFAKDNSRVHGTIASIIKSDEKYEYAIECLLGNLMQNIVVDDENTAKKCIEHLKENRCGRATFLPLTAVRSKNKDFIKSARNEEGFVGFAKDLVSFDSKYENIIDLALSNSIVVDNIDNAINLVKRIKYAAKVVTLDGEILTGTGSISGGSTKQNSTGLVGRNRKIESLKEEIETLKFEYEKLNSEDDLLNKIKEQESILEEEKKVLVKLEVAKNNIIQNVLFLKNSLEKIEKSKSKLLEDKKEEEQNILNYKQKIKENNIILEENNNYLKTKQEEIDTYNRFNKEKSEEADILNEDIVDLKISLSSFDESALSIEEIVSKYLEDIENLNKNNESKNTSIKNLEEENKQIEDAKSNINNILLEYDKKEEEKNIEIASLKDEKNCLNEKNEKLEKENLDVIDELNNLKEEKMRLESRKEKIESEIEASKNRMWNEYEIATSKAKEILKTAEEKIALLKSQNPNLKKVSEKLRLEIRNMGNVNVSSIEEYAKTKERFDFLNTQKEDLENTKVKLLDLIDKMTFIMKKQFKSQFKIITENFNEVFKNLFGGGKAELELEDDTNILECGIDIRVQPPGKKLQNMSLLSGGERALTAIALLFAILKIKAPPFCILDEIEAALDDVNVQRFANYIKKYSKDTQFIVITHRKGTMEVAKTVYGVTMQEYGISKIISMKMK